MVSYCSHLVTTKEATLRKWTYKAEKAKNIRAGALIASFLQPLLSLHFLLKEVIIYYLHWFQPGFFWLRSKII